MGIFDVVEDSEENSITVTVDSMEDILLWLDEHSGTSYPKLTDIGGDLDMRPQKVNAAVEQLEIERWNVDSNSNIRVVNPAAFPERKLPDLEE